MTLNQNVQVSDTTKMKKLDNRIFIFLAIALACNKNSTLPEYYGTASMTINGVNWQADKVKCNVLKQYTCYNNKIAIDFLKFSTEGYLREDYSFEKILPAVSFQKIYPSNSGNQCNDTLDAVYGIQTDDGDVNLAFYNTDTLGASYLNVENYNPETKEISGSFAVTFILLRKDVSATTIVDTIRITNGKFNTKFLN